MRYDKEFNTNYRMWAIVDREKHGKIVAYCLTVLDAQMIIHALEVNLKPSAYGFKLVD